MVYERKLWDRGYDGYPTVGNSLFSAFQLEKNADIDQYKYSGHGITFDKNGTFFSR